MGLGSKHHAAHASRLETRMMRAVGIHPVAELKHTSVQVTIPSTTVLWDRRVVLGNSWESGNGISMSIEQSVTASLRMACSTCHRLQGNLCGTSTSGCSSLMAETSTPCTGPLIRFASSPKIPATQEGRLHTKGAGQENAAGLQGETKSIHLSPVMPELTVAW